MFFISKKNVVKFSKILLSRVGSMVIFSGITSIIIFFVTTNDHLDELANNIPTATAGKMSSNILDGNASFSPVISPFVEKKIITNIESIPFSTEQEYCYYLDEGQTVTYPGVPGQTITEYEHVIVNGKLKNINELSTNKINPKSQKILIGIRKPISSSFESPQNQITLDDNGCPLNYEQLLTNRIATAYTAGFGARTSTNKIPRVGYVAVNPKVIPYHSVMYIKCHNNSLSGIFVAEDTGGALRKGHADIDIFMNTEQQCWNFGRQKIDIYILSKPSL